MPPDSFVSGIKRLLVGKRIPSHLAHHERFGVSTGLAILSSDALSSVAYATEEILRTLLIAGTASLWIVTPIGCVIAGLMLVIAFSYRQTILAYPNGGGAYRVAGENIGVTAGLIGGLPGFGTGNASVPHRSASKAMSSTATRSANASTEPARSSRRCVAAACTVVP